MLSQISETHFFFWSEAILTISNTSSIYLNPNSYVLKDSLSFLYEQNINYTGQIHIVNPMQTGNCDLIKPLFIGLSNLCHTD